MTIMLVYESNGDRVGVARVADNLISIGVESRLQSLAGYYNQKIEIIPIDEVPIPTIEGCESFLREMNQDELEPTHILEEEHVWSHGGSCQVRIYVHYNPDTDEAQALKVTALRCGRECELSIMGELEVLQAFADRIFYPEDAVAIGDGK